MIEKIKKNKEVICYCVVLLTLVIIVICNNIFWKLGKQTESINKVNYLESNNVIYNVPYEEKVLD